MNSLEKNIYRARKTVLEMMEDRGYDISNQIKDIPFELFLETISDNSLEMFFEGNKSKNDCIAYFLITSITKKEFNSLIHSLFKKYDNDNLVIILITIGKPSSTIKKEIINNDDYKNISLFQLNRLIVNITHHNIVPKHRVLDEEEISEICEKLSIRKEQFPKILVSDPISKYYGVKVGNVFEITRFSAAVGNYISYRQVI